MAAASEPLHNAFSRHPRPQMVNVPMVPTKAALARHRLSSASRDAFSPPKPLPSLSSMTVREDSVVESVERRCPAPAPSDAPVIQRSPSDDLKHIGTLVQAGRHIDLCIERRFDGAMVMLRRLAKTDKSSFAQLNHPNICHVRRVFDAGEYLCLESDYFRFMLEEILVVSLPLEVPQLKQIAISVMDGLAYLQQHELVHRVSLQSIRIDSRSGRVALADLDDLSLRANEVVVPNDELASLGLVLLQCMDGRPWDAAFDAEWVRSQRFENRVFGLERAERWSAHKILVDYLDDLFNPSKSASSKLRSRHEFVHEVTPTPFPMLVYCEVAALECFQVWLPVQFPQSTTVSG